MGAILIPIVIIVIAIVAGAITATRYVRRQRARADLIRGAGPSTLRYAVPNGQDPGAVVLGLDRAGFEAVPDATVGMPTEVLIGAPGGKVPDREEVRQVLAGLGQLNFEGDTAPVPKPVRFVDE